MADNDLNSYDNRIDEPNVDSCSRTFNTDVSFWWQEMEISKAQSKKEKISVFIPDKTGLDELILENTGMEKEESHPLKTEGSVSA